MSLTKQAEQACREHVLNGKDKSKAYRKAYPQSLKWKDKTVWNRASELFAKREVMGRVAELEAEARKIAEEQFKVDVAYVTRRHVEIDQMDILDILSDDGALKPISEWPQCWRQTLQGLELAEINEGFGEARQTVGMLKKIKWPDKVKNLELIGKLATVQAYKENVNLTGRLANLNREIPADMPAAEAANIYQDMLKGR